MYWALIKERDEALRAKKKAEMELAEIKASDIKIHKKTEKDYTTDV